MLLIQSPSLMLFNGVCSCVHSEPATVARYKNCKGNAITVASGSMGIGLSLPYIAISWNLRGLLLLWLIDHQRKLNPWNKSTCMCMHWHLWKLNLWMFKVLVYPWKLNPGHQKFLRLYSIMLIWELLIILFSCSQCYNSLLQQIQCPIIPANVVIIPCTECGTYRVVCFVLLHSEVKCVLIQAQVYILAIKNHGQCRQLFHFVSFTDMLLHQFSLQLFDHQALYLQMGSLHVGISHWHCE